MTLTDKVEFDITKECMYMDTYSIVDIILTTYYNLNKEPDLNYTLLKAIISIFYKYYCPLMDCNKFFELIVLYLNGDLDFKDFPDGVLPLSEDINIIIKIYLNKEEKYEISNLYKQDSYPHNILNKYLSEHLISMLGGLKYEG